jgi:hypothetical protein
MKLPLCGALALIVLATPALAAPADCSGAAIPATPVKGSVKGKAFVPTDIHVTFTKNGMGVNGKQFDRYALDLDAGDIFNELSVDMLVPAGKPIDGRTYRQVPGDIGTQPMAAEGTPEVQGWDLQYDPAGVNTNFGLDEGTLRVEWGRRSGDSIPGKIYFCAPAVGAEIMGTFTATVR